MKMIRSDIKINLMNSNPKASSLSLTAPKAQSSHPKRKESREMSNPQRRREQENKKLKKRKNKNKKNEKHFEFFHIK